MVTEITTTAQDIDGDFDLVVRGNPEDIRQPIILQKSLGAGTTNHITIQVFNNQGHHFVKNTGSNSFKLAAAVPGVTVEFNQ